MTDSPLISIIIPLHNQCNLIGQAIRSCVTQKRTNIEVIVVDDGSTDGSFSAATQSVSDKRIRYARQEHSGACSARNHGMRLANGAFVVFLDSDDELADAALQNMVEAFSDDVDFVYGDATLIDECGRIVGAKTFVPGSQDAIDSVIRCCPCNASVMYRTSAILDAYWDESLACCQEFDFTSRVAVSGARARYINAPLVRLRQHTGQRISSSTSNVFPRTLTSVLRRLERTLRREGTLTPLRLRRIHSGYIVAALGFIGQNDLGSAEEVFADVDRLEVMRLYDFEVSLTSSFFRLWLLGPRLFIALRNVRSVVAEWKCL